MRLRDLKLTNYRNCEDISIDFNFNKILIIGKNAQGKTNILESICILSTLKSPRTSNNTELINFNSDTAKINCNLIKSDTDTELDWSYSRDKKRSLAINKVKTTPKNFKSVLKTVLFSTSDLLLLRGNPSDRRDWLDRAISQIYPAYDERLSKYDKIRIQKNNLLKDYLKTGNLNKTLLEVYNEQLVITGSNIIYLRIKFLKEIENIAKEKHKIISESEELRIDYDCSFLNSEKREVESGELNNFQLSTFNFQLDQISFAFKQSIEEHTDEELRRGQTCVGPHRDDIIFYINGNEAVKFASQGQQRTIVLALKLSELDIITQKLGEEPVLLLDDVLAELDDIRQNYLLKSINSNTQTIITSVDTILFEDEFLKDVKIYKIENGKMSN
ncbi:DNA replication/repair protein RecF [bacterium]|nr:DNA replication/repair protein RecF [bacterium]